MNVPHPTRPDVILAVCRDEEDVIEAFVRCHLAMGFDAVYLVDNGSTDHTVDILQTLVSEGLPVHFRSDHRTGYDRYLSEHYHWAGEASGARWLFFLDCDEFVYFSDGAKTYLDRLDAHTNLLRLPQRQMFQDELEADGNTYSFLTATTASIGFEDEPSKVVSRYHPAAKVLGGKHRIDVPEPHEEAPLDLFIRHFKYRSAQQARSKEKNRVNSESTFTEEDLSELSAFGTAATRSWIEESRRLAAAEHWRTWFSPRWPTTFDDVLARWVETRTGVPGAPFPSLVETHPVPAERLLLHETLRRAAGADDRLYLCVHGGSAHLRERLGAEPAVSLCAEPDADCVLFASPTPPDISSVVSTGLRGASDHRWLLMAAPHPEQDTLVAAVRRNGMHAAVFDAAYYGSDLLRRCAAPTGSSLLSIVPHNRAENGVLAPSAPTVHQDEGE